MNIVNIILASYNGEKYIKEQIDSIINSYFTNWKLYIFDDGSTDDTCQIVEDYVKKYPEKIHFHRNEKNKGVTLNFLDAINQIDKINNYAENVIEGNHYYMFCDQDDVWMPDKIERTLNQMKKAEKKYGADSILAVYTDAVVVDAKLEQIHPSFHKTSKFRTDQVDLAHILMENKMIGCTIMFNNPLKQKVVNLPKNVRYHDWWIALIASAFGHITYLPEPTLLYRQHSNNVVGNQSFVSYVQNRITSLRYQKEAVNKTILQGKDFYFAYKNELNQANKKLVYTFANLNNTNWLMKRVVIVKNGYIKSGMIRNLGLLLII